jgi:hypothetical protein
VPTPRPHPRRPLVQVAVLGIILTVLASCSTVPTGDGRPPATPQLDDTSLPPWPAPDDVANRAAAAGLDLGPMGTAEHYHPTLRIMIAGDDVPVAANIGVDPQTGAMSALHTHEPDGTIHIEADTIGQEFTLGQLFTQWGITLTATQIGGVTAAPGQTITVRSNNTTVSSDPNNLRLQPNQRIVLQVP